MSVPKSTRRSPVPPTKPESTLFANDNGDLAGRARVRYILGMLWSRSTTGLLVVLAFAAGSTGCGGPAIPQHDGYRSAKSKPWKKPKRVKLDESNEGDIDGTLSYAKKRRARWYVVDLPSDGELTVKMDMVPVGDRQNIQPGFEVLNSSFKTLVRIEAPREDEDEPRRGKKKRPDEDDEYEDEYDDDDDDDYVDESEELLEWSRTLYELPAGKYYLHVWVNGRLDVAEYSMRVKFARALLEQETDFPAQVAFVSPLPVVPAFDDAPEVDCKSCSCKKDARCKTGCGKCKSSGKPSFCSRCDCSSASCKSRCTRKCGGGTTTAPTGSALTARITRPVASGNGTKITMNRGSSNGVAVGWKGRVVNSAGKPIDNGSFTVTKVSASECVGTVGASPDTVTSAGRVRLTPP